MPLYDYKCKQCQKVTEVRHGFKDVHAQPCPACGGALARVFNAAGIVFKGSGFYITDSRKNSGSGEGAASTSTTAPAAGASTTATSTSPTAAGAPAPSAPVAPSTASESKKSDAA